MDASWGLNTDYNNYTMSRILDLPTTTFFVLKSLGIFLFLGIFLVFFFGFFLFFFGEKTQGWKNREHFHFSSSQTVMNVLP